MNILNEIYKYKIEFVDFKKKITSTKELIDKANRISKKNNNFSKNIISNLPNINIIGELKKASPSAGDIINKNLNYLDIAKVYEKNGIICLSVLTDEKYFKGKLADIVNVKKSTTLPILRKDFMVDIYQVYEAFLSGADCILIILAMVDMETAHKLEEVANYLGLDVIIEIHNEHELKKATKLKSNLIGINNRNLKDFSVNIMNAVNLSNSIDSDKIIISESGIKTKQDIKLTTENSNIRTFLVGESLMKSSDIPSSIHNLIN